MNILETVSNEVFGVWFLIGAALVFFMQCGFAMVETGFTRAKNAGNIIMKNLMDFCIGTPMFLLLGLIGQTSCLTLFSAPLPPQSFPAPWQKERNLYHIAFTAPLSARLFIRQRRAGFGIHKAGLQSSASMILRVLAQFIWWAASRLSSVQ